MTNFFILGYFSLSHIIQAINSYIDADALCEGFVLDSSVIIRNQQTYSELAKSVVNFSNCKGRQNKTNVKFFSVVFQERSVLCISKKQSSFVQSFIWKAL